MRMTSRAGLGLAGLALIVSGLVATPTPSAGLPPEPTSDALVFAPTKDDDIEAYGSGFGSSQGPVPAASQVFTGDFTDEAGTEVFLYQPGPGPDAVISGLVSPSSGSTEDRVDKSVGGTYVPLVGDFDGNGFDDVLWYGPGSTADSLWRFSGNGSHAVVPLTISGRYRPVVIEADGDGDDDVIWYAPGTAGDTIWLFGAGASRTAKRVRIDGDYTPVTGIFGIRPEGSPQERLIFWKQGGADAIWTFDTDANHTSQSLFIPDGRPVVGDFTADDIDSVMWYQPGPGAEGMVSFDEAGTARLDPAPPVSGTYEPVVLDFDGNGAEDIAWTRNGGATIWRFGAGAEGLAYSQSSLAGNDPNRIATAVYRDPADL